VANNLSTAQRAAFSGGSYDLVQFPRKAELDDRLGTVVDVTSRVLSFGQTRVSLFNLNPANPGDFEFPFVSWTLLNSDGYLSPGAPGALWGSMSPASFLMRFRVFDLATDPTGSTLLVDQRFVVTEVQLDEFEARVVGIIPLARYWSRVWSLEDRDAIDWDGWEMLFTM
jgi:hypothetical protein